MVAVQVPQPAPTYYYYAPTRTYYYYATPRSYYGGRVYYYYGR